MSNSALFDEHEKIEIEVDLNNRIHREYARGCAHYLACRGETTRRIRAIKFRKFGDEDEKWEDALRVSIQEFKDE